VDRARATVVAGVAGSPRWWWLVTLLSACGSDNCRQQSAETAPPLADDSGDSVSPLDSGSLEAVLRGEPDFECPDLEVIPERSLDVALVERPDLQGHGWTVRFRTEEPELATVFFAPEGPEGPCLHALSTGWYEREHALELSNLRLGTDYLALVKLTDRDGVVSRSQVLRIRTSAPMQQIPSGFERSGIYGGTVWFDAALLGPVPGDVVIATSVGLCGVDFGSPSMGSQALLLDSEGFLVGNYIASQEVQGYAQVHATITGSPGFDSGNGGLRLHIGGGIPNQARVATMDLLGGVDFGVEQPEISASNYAMNYMDWVITDTAALEASGVHFEGTAHLAILSRNEDFHSRSEVVFWDEGLVTDENAGDPEAWTVWGYPTVELTTHESTNTYANSVYYNAVRNEVVIHSHQDLGGMVWGVGVADQRLNWVFGYDVAKLDGYVHEEAIIISEIDDPGLCDAPFFARGHRVATWNVADEGPESFFLSMHDNGGAEGDVHTHTRAIVYHLALDEAAGTATTRVHWAYPSNPLEPDEPHYDLMAYHNYVYGGLSKVPNHDDLFLLTSGTGYCYEDVNEEGLPTREQMVLLRALPASQTAEVLAVYTPGSDDFDRVTLYSATPTALAAQVGPSSSTSGRRSFEVAVDDDAE
jgi:hypothetical protein